MKKIGSYFSLIFLLLIGISGVMYSQVPSSPTKLNATVKNLVLVNSVTLTWDASSSGNEEVKFSVYRKDYNASDSTLYKIIGTSKQKSFTDFVSSSAGTYSYYVSAVNGFGESQPSNRIEVKITAAAAKTAVITGSLANDKSGEPIKNGLVNFIPANIATLVIGNEPQIYTAKTDDKGNFKITLYAGSYYLHLSANNYISEYFENSSDRANAKIIDIKEKDSLNLKISLAAVQVPTEVKGTISGVLYNENTNAPIKNGLINCIPSNIATFVPGNEPLINTVKTDANGIFKIALDAGKYYLQSSASGFISEYYDNASERSKAKIIEIKGNDNYDVKILLSPDRPKVTAKGIISGELYDEKNNVPIINGLINFVPLFVNTFVPGNEPYIYTTKTDDKGFFKITLDTGSYYIQSSASGFISEYYNNAADRATAKIIDLKKDDSLFIKIELPPLVKGVISGTVVSESTKGAIPNGLIEFMPTGISSIYSYIIFTKTDSLGNYNIKLDAGEYFIRASAPYYRAEYYENASSIAEAKVIKINNTDKLIYNFELKPEIPLVNYTISGSVKNDAGLGLRAKIQVLRLNKSVSNFIEDYLYGSSTDSDGKYSIKVKANDSVIVYAEPYDKNYISEYYNDKSTFQEATRIIVNSNITDINFALNAKPVYSNSISGKVFDTAGTAVVASVSAYNLASSMKENNRTSILTDSLGKFTLTNLTPGKYLLLAIPHPGYLPVYYKAGGVSTSNRSEADTVIITASSLLTDINFTVKKMKNKGRGFIFGKYKDHNGNSLNGTMSFAVNSNNEVVSYSVSDEEGNVTIDGLSSDNYSLVSDLFDYKEAVTSDLTVDENSSSSPYLQITLYADGINNVNNSESAVPSEYNLSQNYPNPFNPSTVIKYQVPKSGLVTLKVFDILGNEVALLVNGTKQAGSYQVNFDASKLSSGVYLYQLKADNVILTKKLMLLK